MQRWFLSTYGMFKT